MEKLAKFFKSEEGLVAIEYALIAVGIAVFIIVSVNLVGDKLAALFNTIAGKLVAR